MLFRSALSSTVANTHTEAPFPASFFAQLTTTTRVAMSDADGSPPRDAMDQDNDSDGRPERSPRQRSRSPARKDPPANNARNNERERDPDADILKISDEDAAFVLGKGGNTKRKIARVAGAKLEIIDMKSDPGMKGAEIEITGTDAARARAKDYIGYVLAQRTGPVYIDHTMRRDDLSILMVPMDCVGYVMGRGGQVLRDMENEWGTLMFFAKKKEDEGKADADAKDGKVQEILAIFGTRRSRRGAELKVMSAVEHKKPGHFLDGEALRVPLDQPGDGENDDFDYDVFPFRGDEFSYALGGDRKSVV